MRTGSTNLVHVTFIPTHLLVRPVAGTADRHDTTSLDAHRFDASLAEAEAAIEEWHSFVEEIRARKVRPSS